MLAIPAVMYSTSSEHQRDPVIIFTEGLGILPVVWRRGSWPLVRKTFGESRCKAPTILYY
jgi:hypothetical protein